MEYERHEYTRFCFFFHEHNWTYALDIHAMGLEDAREKAIEWVGEDYDPDKPDMLEVWEA